MVKINRRLNTIFEPFCKEFCRHRQSKRCQETLKKAELVNCPIGEWWDLNDYLNAVEDIVAMLKDKYDTGKPKGKLSDL